MTYFQHFCLNFKSFESIFNDLLKPLNFESKNSTIQKK